MTSSIRFLERRWRQRRVASVALVGVLLACAAVARAQPAPAACAVDGASGKEAFAEGRRLYAAGRFAEAAGCFERAHARAQRPELLFNAAQAHRLAGAC